MLDELLSRCPFPPELFYDHIHPLLEAFIAAEIPFYLCWKKQSIPKGSLTAPDTGHLVNFVQEGKTCGSCPKMTSVKHVMAHENSCLAYNLDRINSLQCICRQLEKIFRSQFKVQLGLSTVVFSLSICRAFKCCQTSDWI